MKPGFWRWLLQRVCGFPRFLGSPGGEMSLGLLMTMLPALVKLPFSLRLLLIPSGLLVMLHAMYRGEMNG